MALQRNTTLYRVQNSSSIKSIDEVEILGLLQHLDKDTLEKLNDSEEKLLDLLNDQQNVKHLEQDKELLIASNKSLAEYNLKFQPKIHQSREMLGLKYEQVMKLKEEYGTILSVLESGDNHPSLDTAHALLQTKAAESEEQTEILGEEFLDSKMDCDTFLEQYLLQRTQCHLLKIKAEKLGEMVQQNVGNVHHHNMNTRQETQPSGQTCPYPVGPAGGMPLPNMYR